tara:strand:+ start:85440 stop:85658 length:219 start_codon:yes stop_codon:yes gene_type:complete
MKKLSLKNLKLEANDMLQRNHLKSVIGGYEVSSCSATCDEETIVTCSGTNCSATDYEGCTSDIETKSCSPAV